MAALGILAVSAFLLGLLFGSFLNVVISRIPRGESIVRPRSRCPNCGHSVRGYDNIPILSWILLRARCRDCHAPISWRYPAVELAAGLWFIAVTLLCLRTLMQGLYVQLSAAQYASLVLSGVSLGVLGLLLIALLVIDWKHLFLPDALTLTGIFTGFVLICAQAALLPTTAFDVHFDPRRNLRIRSPGSFIARGDVFLTGTERLVFGRVAAVLGAVLLLLLVRWMYFALRGRHRRDPALRHGLGLGDVKLLAMIAAFLGLAPAILSLFLGVLLATAYALVLLARGRANALTRLPFGSFLALGGLVTALAGDRILAWYKSLL